MGKQVHSTQFLGGQGRISGGCARVMISRVLSLFVVGMGCNKGVQFLTPVHAVFHGKGMKFADENRLLISYLEMGRLS